ncbi:MAG TPA: DUF2779 domain-containing protein, partial [Candidatus Polarisedimenticolaceae bacterium]|nr:DUF2779 domain-containing protein [Candidatus Polarisedimenticolaceae bacterium]
GQKVIFQASVLTNRRLYARADVVIKQDDGSWHIYEIKSATKVKPEYIHDLAFQKIALEESTYSISATYIVHINSHYVRQGELDSQQLFVQTDVTDQVTKITGRTRERIKDALKIISLPACPDDSPAFGSNWYAWRDNYRFLHPEIPDTSIYNLTRLKPEQLSGLLKRGISDMLDIPAAFELGPQQKAQLIALKAGEPVIHPVKIAVRLARLRFPLYFFDYETVGSGLPAYDGTRPYQQVPFQYSLHILDKPEGKLRHTEFLATGSANPMPALLEQMKHDIGPEGSVIVWYKGFEMGVNDAMAVIYPEYKAFLKQVNKRVFDLMEIFSNFYYSDAAFGGSASIKKVLPVVVPELSYGNLAIQKGDVASKLWEQTAKGKITGGEAEQIYENLRIYCGQDTLAMVRIYEFLINVSKTAPGAQLSLLG